MLKEKMLLLNRLHVVSDIFLTVMAYYVAALAATLVKSGSFYFVAGFALSDRYLLAVVIIWSFLILNQTTPYAYRMKTYVDMVRPVVVLVLKGACGFLIWLYISKSAMPSRIFLFLFLATDFLLLVLLRIAVVSFLQVIRARGKNCEQVLVVGTGKLARKVIDDIKDNPKWGIRAIGILDVLNSEKFWRYRDVPLIGGLDDLGEIVKCNQVDYVVYAANRKFLNRLDKSVQLCEKMGVKACVLTDFFDTKIARRQVSEFLFHPAIIYSTVNENHPLHFAKSVLDRTGAFIGLIVSAPIMGLIATLVKMTSRGPVFFAQERCGLNGRRFKLYKFRTMIEDAERFKESLASKNEMDGPAFKISNDPRITRFGKFLRKTSLDEIPQLFNVVKGEMSFVGPRPPLPDEVRRYDRWQRRKLSIKPGLTCLWQVSRRNSCTFEEWMKLDLQYIDNWSLWMDTKILLKTIPTVINGTGK